MSEKELLSIIEKEIDELKNKQKSIQENIKSKETSLKSREYKQLKYELITIEKEIELLQKLLDLPTYERIKTMSEIEQEEKFKELKNKRKTELNFLEKSQKQIKKRYDNLTDELKQLENKKNKTKDDILRANLITNELNEKKLAKINQEIHQAQERLNALKTLPKECIIPTLLCNKIGKDYWDYIEKIDNIEKILELHTSSDDFIRLVSPRVIQHDETISSEFTQFVEPVASDPEKAVKMAELLETYKKITDEPYPKKKILVGPNIPDQLKEELTDIFRYIYNNPNSIDSVPISSETIQKFIIITEDYIRKFEVAAMIFGHNYTMDNLSKLIHIKSNNFEEADIAFLERNIDKFQEQKLISLKKHIKKKNGIISKIFFKNEIERIIYLEKKEIYEEIINWYKNNEFNKILGITEEFQFTGQLEKSIEKCKIDIYNTEIEINRFEERLIKTKTELNNERDINITRKAEVIQEIGILRGHEEEKDKIPYNPKYSWQNLKSITDIQYLELIAEVQCSIYIQNVISKVQQAAKKIAQIEENRLLIIQEEQMLEGNEQTMDNNITLNNKKK